LIAADERVRPITVNRTNALCVLTGQLARGLEGVFYFFVPLGGGRFVLPLGGGRFVLPLGGGRFVLPLGGGRFVLPLGGGRFVLPLGGGRFVLPLGGGFAPPLGGGFAPPLGGGRFVLPLGGGRLIAISATGLYSPRSSSGTAKTMEASNSSSIGSPKSRKTFEIAANDSKRKRLFI